MWRHRYKDLQRERDRSASRERRGEAGERDRSRSRSRSREAPADMQSQGDIERVDGGREWLNSGAVSQQVQDAVRRARVRIALKVSNVLRA